MQALKSIVAGAVIVLAFDVSDTSYIELSITSALTVIAVWLYAMGPTATGVLGSLLLAGGAVCLQDNTLPKWLYRIGTLGCIPFAFAFADSSSKYAISVIALSQLSTKQTDPDLLVCMAGIWLLVACISIFQKGKEIKFAKWPLEMHLWGCLSLFLLCMISKSTKPIFDSWDYQFNYYLSLSSITCFLMILGTLLENKVSKFWLVVPVVPVVTCIFPSVGFVWSLVNAIQHLPMLTYCLLYTFACGILLLGIPLPLIPAHVSIVLMTLVLCVQYWFVDKQYKAKLRYELELEALSAFDSL